MKLFLVGCGFTKAVFPDAPLNDELIDALEKWKPNSSASTLIERYPTKNIERALTNLDVDLSTLSATSEDAQSLIEVRRRIESDLVGYFSRFTASVELLDRTPWLSTFLMQAFDPGDAIITLNYDCLLEGALDLNDLWSPVGGYGAISNPLINNNEYQESPITVLKIHGSTNFIESRHFDNPGSEALHFEFNETIFPKSGRGTSFGGGVGDNPRVIAPSYVKIPNVDLTYLMLDAIRLSCEATQLVIIGSSLRPEDSFLTLLATNFLRQNGWRERRIVIVTPEADAVTTKIKQYWGVPISQCLVPICGRLEDSVGEAIQAVRRPLRA